MIMNTELFEKYYKDNDYPNAYMVIKNQFNKNSGDFDVFQKFADLGLKIASMDITFAERKNCLNEVSHGLALYSDCADLNENRINEINDYSKKIAKVYNGILADEREFDHINEETIVVNNNKVLDELGTIYYELESAKTQTQFDSALEKISTTEAKLKKNYFNETQQSTYDTLTKHYSNAISSKMEELNNLELLEMNKKATRAFKQAYDSFKRNKSSYKDEESNLKALLRNNLFVFDTRKLFNETLVYYNHVYSTIFNEVSDDMKFKMTEWSLETAKIKG